VTLAADSVSVDRDVCGREPDATKPSAKADVAA
jgi:hypothetical protein